MEKLFRDTFVNVCPYCGHSEMIETLQTAYGAVSAKGNSWRGLPLYHTVCRRCGSVVRSYVQEPEKLLKKKDRRKY